MSTPARISRLGPKQPIDVVDGDEGDDQKEARIHEERDREYRMQPPAAGDGGEIGYGLLHNPLLYHIRGE